MFPGTTGWALCVGIVFTVWIIFYLRRGPAEALIPAMILSFACPVWLRIELPGIPFGVRTSMAIVAILAYAVHPRGRILSPLVLLDVCVAFIWCSHVFTDSLTEGFAVTTPLKAYGEWVLPYVVGRYTVLTNRNLPGIARWAAGVMIFLSVMAMIECLTSINPFEVLVGQRPEELANRNADRLGFKRAYATAMHPIYFGMILAILAPWIACLMDRDEPETANRTLGWITIISSLGGLLATVSRTPMVTFLGIGVFLLFVRVKWFRIPIAIAVAGVVLTLAIWPNEVVDAVAGFTGGGDKKKLVELHGEAVVYTGTRARLLLPKVYANAMWHAGLAGYGTEATMTFPPRIPYLEGTAEIKDSLKLVDNGYIVTVLRFGWLGGFLLFLLLISGAVSAWSLYRDRPQKLFSASVTGLLLIYAFLSLLLVSQVYDFAMPLLWLLGVIGGLCSRRIESRTGHILRT